MPRDILEALRAVWRRPAVTVLLAGTLAIGIAATTVAFTIADAVLWHPLPFANSDRLVRVRGVVAADHALPDTPGVLDAILPFTLDSATIRIDDEPEAVTIGEVTPGSFAALGIRPSAGRELVVGDAESTVVVNAKLWHRLTDPATGATRHLLVEGQPQTIVGAMPDGFEFPVSRVVLWRSYVPPQGRYAALGILHPGTPIGTAQAFARTLGLSKMTPVMQITPFVAVDPVTANALDALLWAVALVLVIATANAIQVALSDAVRRDTEMALRAALGASRVRLARLVLIETLVAASAAVGVAWLVASLTLATLVKGVPYFISFQALRPIDLNGRAFLVACLAALGAAVVTTAFAALRGTWTARTPVRQDRGIIGTAPRLTRLRHLLIVAQLAVTIAVVSSAGLLAKTVRQLDHADRGFEPDGVLDIVFQLPQSLLDDEPTTRVRLDELRVAAAGMPGVAGATVSNTLPPGLMTLTAQEVVIESGATRSHNETIWFGRVDDGFFSTLRIPVVAGRVFDGRDRHDTEPVAVVSRSLAGAWWPDGNAIGQRFRSTPTAPWQVVVGIVGDAPNTDVDRAHGTLAFYTPRVQSPTWFYEGLIVRAAGDPLALVPQLRALVHRALPDAPVIGVDTADEMVANANLRTRFAARFMIVFAGVAFILATIGVYGAFWYAVRQRTRELGLRLAIGASASDVRGLILRESLRLVLAGTVIGLPLAVLSGRALRPLLLNVSATDPATIALVIGIVAAAAIGATYLPARRAAHIDPLDALRAE